ncbi:MAG: hypothetical protein KGJ29_15395, partial [Hyphomicrobiales bacterium]|nr:hypothetical protein [Hyphomicrobiales bacterium]
MQGNSGTIRSGTVAPAPDVRLLMERLLQAQAFGLCAFGTNGVIVMREGLPANVGLEPGSVIDDWPAFTGLLDTLLALQQSGGKLELPAIGHNGLKFDIAISWFDEFGLFIARFFPAQARTKLDAMAAQAPREKRILLEKIRRQQGEIEARNELMRRFIAGVPAAVAMLDERLRYVMVSARWQKELVQAGVDVAGLRFGQGFAGKVKRWEAALRRLDKAALGGIEKIEAGDGKTQWLRWERADMAATSAHGVRTLLFAENITEDLLQTQKLRAQGRKLASLNDEMRRFALAASHDLRAPLRQIGSFASFLQEDHAAQLEPEGQIFVGRIEACADRMGGMLDALLRYAKITPPEGAPGAVSLSKVVQAARANLRAEWRASEAHMRMPRGLIVMGDAGLLTILFQNLIDNALKYANARPLQMAISAEPGRDGMLDLSFADNGGGIAP